ncbi:MAG: glycosyltransferase [Lachnospiraceae bacterium]|nr:glycosyltransferase [Lachnospiraceae bacterium]
MTDINISIIIPHYNIPDMLERLLLSSPFDKDDVEVIVVDDKSERDIDKLLEVKKRFENSGVRFFRNNSEKKGAGICRNIGLKHASGQWIIFADADDCFMPGMYETVKRYIDSRSDIVFFESKSMDENGNRTDGRAEGYNRKVENYTADPNRRNELLLRYDMPVPWGKMYRRKVIEENGIWFPDMMVSEDAVFNCKFGCAADKISVADEKIYIVTERENSLSTKRSTYKFRLQVNAFAQMCRFIKKNVSSEDWRELGFNGNLKMIEAFRNFGILWALYVFFVFTVNGICPVSFKGMSLKTAPETLRKISEGRSI